MTPGAAPTQDEPTGALERRLGALPPSVAGLAEAEQEHLAGLIDHAVEQETGELIRSAVAELNNVPTLLRRPLMKLLNR